LIGDAEPAFEAGALAADAVVVEEGADFGDEGLADVGAEPGVEVGAGVEADDDDELGVVGGVDGVEAFGAEVAFPLAAGLEDAGAPGAELVGAAIADVEGEDGGGAAGDAAVVGDEEFVSGLEEEGVHLPQEGKALVAVEPVAQVFRGGETVEDDVGILHAGDGRENLGPKEALVLSGEQHELPHDGLGLRLARRVDAPPHHTCHSGGI